MDEINKIRKSFFSEGKNRNQIAKKHNRSWGTINSIVRMQREELKDRGKHPDRVKKVMTPEVIKAIEDYFELEKRQGVKKKQRYTATQIYKELKERGIYKGKMRRMQAMVIALRKKEGQTKAHSFLPLDFPIGSALQVDHGECEIKIEEQRYKGYLFVASIPGQVLRYCQIFPTKASESWGEFHERSFQFFGGVFPRVIYDNDAVLIKKIIGSERKQTDFSLGLEEHYGFGSHFCNVRAGNEKGSVENSVGYCRRNFLTGFPSFISWESPNEFLSDCCLKDIETKVHYKTGEKLSNLMQQVKEVLTPLPPKKAWCRWIDCRVNKYQLVNVDHHQYSVPERFIGGFIRVALTTSKVEIFKEEELVAEHQRQYGGKDALNLDHYLDQLKRKPGAFPYAKPVTQSNFDPELLKMWCRLSKKYGNREANRQFVSILLLRRRWSQKELLTGVAQALDLGAIDCAAVETILRQKQLSNNSFIENLQGIMPTDAIKWDVDLSSYKELCQGIAL